MDRTAIREDANLLIMAKKIFGSDVVQNAFITTWDIMSEKHEVLERIGGNTFQRVEDEIRYDSEDIIIEFTGGAKVLFTNSERASMSSVDDAEIYHV